MPENVLILGGGIGGVVAANALRKRLPRRHEIVVVDREPTFSLAASFLWAMNAKLEVSFFRPFWGDYWIIDLADAYTYAVVGHPGRD